MEHSTTALQSEIIEFLQDLIRIKSYSGEEEQIIRFIERKMNELGFDEVKIDAMGNLLGRVGNGKKIIMLDSHVDTVHVNDAEEWVHPPFDAVIENGYINGRGSVDMKSSVAASIYAAILAKRNGRIEGKTVYVSCTVQEEDCDGENLKHLFAEFGLKPDYVIICEPSNNNIAIGHRGKAQVAIKTNGVAAHGAVPELGVNAVYEMAEIIARVERLNDSLSSKHGPKGNVVLSKISSISDSLNAVPSVCEIYLDRRTVLEESKADVIKEMDDLVKGKNASWQIGTLERTSWTGLKISYEPFHTAWKLDAEHELYQAAVKAYTNHFKTKPSKFEYWEFSTNAVTPVVMGIPTIGFGPGDYKLAHMRDERCKVDDVLDACNYYVELISTL
ncbi:MAG: YgeY family selenium metabolism-linked hydrolase [Saprospiraceae bacterium]|nr:YgeY family selenium metabolism-linked hydrolase [Saprospiraceae bacterium]